MQTHSLAPSHTLNLDLKTKFFVFYTYIFFLLSIESSLCSSMSSASSMSDLSSVSGGGGTSSKMEYHSLDFKIQIDCVKSGQETYVHLVAPTKQDKAAWITDISQVNFIKLLT